MNVFAFFESLIESCKCKGQISRARNYQKTLNSFSSFLEHRDISFAEMDEGMIGDYERWLQDGGLTPNSSSFYIRNLRAVYNHAVKHGYAARSFMFEDVYTGVVATPDRKTLSEEDIAKLLRLDLSRSRPLALTRDLFVFSYFTHGMAFVDIAFLRKTDMEGDLIRYVVRKSERRETVRMESVAQSIVLKYADATRESDYVFPIITETDTAKAYSQYQIALSYHNRKLKRLGRMIGECVPLSHSVARNTWVRRTQDDISDI